MKPIIPILFATFLSGCLQVRPLIRNEVFVKNEIEKIKLSEEKTSTQYLIYKGFTDYRVSDATFVEISGYTGKEGKYIIIGYANRTDVVGQGNVMVYKYAVDYIKLDVEQTKLLINKLPELITALKNKKKIFNEIVYSDYRISDELVISINVKNSSTINSTIDFWAKGVKISIPRSSQNNILDRLKVFLSR
jgi:hypothetical protein